MQLSAINAALGRFLAELQRRKVLRVAATYLVGAWIVLQVAVALQTAMSLSASFSAAILALLVIGFPVALVLSWFFEVTHEGVRRTAPASGELAPFKLQTTDLILAGALALVIVFGIVQLMTASNTTPAAITTTAEVPKPPALGDKSIAVLPFKNLSADKENEYLADGMTEEILDLLARIGDLKVISRTSSFTFRGKNTPLPEIARQLGVRHILEGSVREQAGELRVTAQLIDVVTDTHLWSETYERSIENSLAMQEEIARDIAGALKLEVALANIPRVALTKNVEAYRLFLKARALYYRRVPGDVLKSVELYKQAIALDAGFAEAHAGLAASYVAIGTRSATYFRNFSPKAQQSAETAIKLKPTLSRAYGVLGSLARYKLAWADAIRFNSKAVALDPSDAHSIGGLGAAFLYVGEFEQAARYLNEAKRIDPIYNFVGWATQMTLAYVQRDDQTLHALAIKLADSTSPTRSMGYAALSIHAKENGNAALAEKHLRAMMNALGRHGAIVEVAVRAQKSPVAFGIAEAALKAEAANDPSFESEPVLLTIGDIPAYFDTLIARLERGDTVRTTYWIIYAWRLHSTSDSANRKFKVLFREAGIVDYWRKHGWPDRCRAKGEDDFECS